MVWLWIEYKRIKYKRLQKWGRGRGTGPQLEREILDRGYGWVDRPHEHSISFNVCGSKPTGVG